MGHSLLDKLADTDRCQVESWLAAFDLAWAAGRLTEEVNRLPGPGSSLRVPALVGLARIDLERCWQQGSRCRAEDYLQRFPELRASEAAVAELKDMESQVRLQFGDAVDELELIDDPERPTFEESSVTVRRLAAMFAASGAVSLIAVVGWVAWNFGPRADSPSEPGEPLAAASHLSSNSEKSEKVSTHVTKPPSGLDDPDRRVRKKAAEALAEQKKKEAVPLLIVRIADDRCDVGFTDDKDAALAALKTLARDRVTEALRLALRSANPRTRAWAAERFTEPEPLAPGQSLLAKDAEIVPALRRCLDDKSRLVRAAAAKSLGRWHNTEQTQIALDPLVNRLADVQFNGSFPQDKDEALRALAVLAPDRVVDALSKALKSPAAPVRRWAAGQHSVLNEIPEVKRPLPAYAKWKTVWVKSLIAALEDEEWAVREATAGSLEELRDPAAVPALVQRVGDDRFDPRFPRDKDRALRALRKLAPGEVNNALLLALKSPKESVRNWALRKFAESAEKK